MPCTIRDVLKVVRLLQLPAPKFATFPSRLAGTVFRGVPQSPSRIHQMSQEEPGVLAPRREGCWKTSELWPSLGKERHTSKVE